MAGRVVRAAIVGAASILGKELADELNASSAAVWELALFDTDEASGQMTAAGDEAMVIQEVGSASFVGTDVVFFAGDAATTRQHWKAALKAGTTIVDLSAALQDEKDALIRCPWMEMADAKTLPVPDLTTKVVVPAHPAAVMLALIAARLRLKWSTPRLIATVLEPASQQGKEGLDELHQQTVGVLSFQTPPKDVYDAQVAFNMNARLGGAAKLDLDTLAARIRRHYEAIVNAGPSSIPDGEAGSSLALQLLQAPVFNGYTASIYAQFSDAIDPADVLHALQGSLMDAHDPDEVDATAPSNLSVVEQGRMSISVRSEPGMTNGVWLWVAVDNLRLAARNASACAMELIALRPAGKVQ